MTIQDKPTVVVMYEYFYPGYKAGGPVQSLVNMIVALHSEYNFKVITTAYDLNEQMPYNNIMVDEWNNLDLNKTGCIVPVWYSSKHKIAPSKMLSLLKQVAPRFVYVNGLFTQWFSLPLLLKRIGFLKNIEVIVSPRGMLQQGALAVKPTKKKIFLQVFKVGRLFNHVRWHATTTDESDDIKNIIDNNAKAIVAANIPKKPIDRIMPLEKIKGELKLVYLSIITEKKNLLFLMQSLSKVESRVSLDIYGPIKEDFYWQLCEQAILSMPNNISITYRGDVRPDKVQETLQQYHAFVSLTQGENFGHALYESFSVARPVITSHFTPWTNLQQKQAGCNVSIDKKDEFIKCVEHFSIMEKQEFEEYCLNAYHIANEYYNNSDFINSYRKLFA